MEEEAEEFLNLIQEYTSDDNMDLTDAYVYAMSQVTQYDGYRWFGDLCGGSFYCDTNITRWFPDISIYEASFQLNMEFGEGFTDDLI